jgi:two-component system, chemotaxis family, sensor kinase CheA
MDFDKALLDGFLAEACEHLSTLEDDFLELERTADDPDPDLVGRVFRAIHSVKGGSTFLELTRIKELAHAMETMLSMVRDGALTPGPDHIDALLRGVDLLTRMVADPDASNEMDISGILNRLSLLGGGDCAPAPTTPCPPEPTAEQTTEPATPASSTKGGAERWGITADRYAELLILHDYLYELRYDLLENPAESPATLMESLGQSGEVLDARLILEGDDLGAGLPSGPLRFEVLYGSLLDPDFVDAATGLPEEQTILLELPCEPVAEPPASASDDDTTKDLPSPNIPDAPNVPDAEAVCRDASIPSVARTSTLRVNVDILDKLMVLAGELVLVRNQQLLSKARSDPAFRDMVQRLDMVTTELQESIMRTRMQPIGNIFGKLPRLVRDLSSSLGKPISLSMTGQEVELDKTILESLTDPLTHILRNCCDHGIEPPETREQGGKSATGRITVEAYHEGGQINIEIADDGKGVDVQAVKRKALEKELATEAELAQMSDKEAVALIMAPGFSTAESVSDVSGRGVGMDVVKHALEELGGNLELESWPGRGTRLHLRLPLTLAIIPSLIVMDGKHRYAIPQVNLEELVRLYDEDAVDRIEVAGNQEVYRLRERLLPMVRLSEILAHPERFHGETKAEIAEKYHCLGASPKKNESRPTAPESLSFAVVKAGANRYGLIVDQVLGAEEIVVKPMHPSLKPLKCYSGATVMGDGSVSLILDIEGIAEHAGVFLEQSTDKPDTHARPADYTDNQPILLFKCGGAEQFALALPLARRIERISISRMEQVGDREFYTVEDCATLVLRLDNLLDLTPCAEQEDMFLILPKFATRPFGILMTEIIDIVEAPVRLNTESYMEDGLLGTDIIRGHLTLFPDIYRLIEKAEPQWFLERKQAAPPPDVPRRVLVVEDSPFLRKMIRAYLESDHYLVDEAEHGKDALNRMEEKQFDIVVSDIEMPVMDGLEFIKNVRHGSGQRSIPAMALTSLSREADRRKALESGFDAYQVKIDRERFLSEVAILLASVPEYDEPKYNEETVHGR